MQDIYCAGSTVLWTSAFDYQFW